MSPTDRIADVAKPAAPADVVVSSERATDHIHEEKSEVLEAALVKVLAMLGYLSERMFRIAPADVVVSSERATDHIHEEKSEVLEAALVKVLAMLGYLSERMFRMESSQSGQARKHRKESAESSVFDPVFGVGAAMNLQDLERNASPKRSRNLSPATQLGSRRPAQFAGNYGMGQAPELGVHAQRLPDYHYPGIGMQNLGFVPPGRQIEGVPDS
uniref:AlNc14C927G12639 protein n=1 Tax=Albugo laibachii Nc14 TaxID=890382 RepID=F0X2A2_9STRA|nr:AlNc14C927G12639 [Albugo laibachii Nc14]|eukprot:CCA27982.1 AlNc14C927G12639 [Albugo laibachii Nc14]